MADAFDEVEQGLREDRYQVLLRRYGPAVGGLVALIVLAAAGHEGLKAMDAAAAKRSSLDYVAALELYDEGKHAEAREKFAALAKKGAKGYRALAKMQEAAAALQMGEKLRASALYEEAARLAPDRMLADLAGLQAAYARADEISPSDLLKLVEPLADDDRPYFTLARELVGAAALAAGDLSRAREEYSYLSLAPDAPQGVKRRAQQALAVIRAGQAASAAPPKEDEG